MKLLRKLFRLLGATFSLSLRASLAHRVNFAFDLGLSLIGLTAVLVTTVAIYRQTDSLAGWSRSEALVLIGVFALVSGIRGTFIDPSLTKFVGTIRDGTMDEALLRPAPSWFTTTFREHAPLALGQSVLGIGVIVVGVSGLSAPPGTANVIVAIVLIACAVAITWALSVSLACLGFWAGRFELAPLTASLWDVGRNPAEVYRTPVRHVVTYILPLAGMITLPATALTRADPLRALVTGMALAVMFVGLAMFLFRQGLKRYTGATS